MYRVEPEMERQHWKLGWWEHVLEGSWGMGILGGTQDGVIVNVTGYAAHGLHDSF